MVECCFTWVDLYHPPQEKAPKGRRKEQKRQLNSRLAYAAAVERWANECPSVVKLWAVKKWLKAMPRKEDFYD